MNNASPMNKLRETAMDLGAGDAKIIPAHLIPVEDAVLEMCKKPLCAGFGKSVNCPPHTMPPKEFRELVKEYEYALVFKIDVPTEIMMSNKKDDTFHILLYIE